MCSVHDLKFQMTATLEGTAAPPCRVDAGVCSMNWAGRGTVHLTAVTWRQSALLFVFLVEPLSLDLFSLVVGVSRSTCFVLTKIVGWQEVQILIYFKKARQYFILHMYGTVSQLRCQFLGIHILEQTDMDFSMR